ncbi:Phosphoribosyl-AMP cyclohydrolase [Candidatus Hodgkinia cicadicola]|nr:Phosphoribosyl-AMP cyclohydrolase [Candidatus Hodgkinia cicadicola]
MTMRVLAPVVVVDHFTGETLMFAFVNKLCLRLSFITGVAHYYSRERARLWLKGEVSGNVHSLTKAYADCDSDLLLFSVVVLCEGYSCHTLRRSCVYKRLW